MYRHRTSQAGLSRAEPSQAGLTRAEPSHPQRAHGAAPHGALGAHPDGRAESREMIFVPFGSSPPPHNLVTKSTGTSSEQIISEGQHIAAQAMGKAPKFTPWANNPLPIARSGDSIVVPTGRIPPRGRGGRGGQQAAKPSLPVPRAPAHGSPRGNDPPHSGSTQTPASLTEMPPRPKAPCCQTPPGAVSPPPPPITTPEGFPEPGGPGGWAGG